MDPVQFVGGLRLPPPIPLSEHQLDNVRRALRELVRLRGATYSQVAEQLDVDEEVLKAFCLGRSKRPRGTFLRNLVGNIRRIGPFFEELSELRYAFTDLLIEISKNNSNISWYDEFSKYIGISRVEISYYGQELVGRYVMYRNSGNGMLIHKTRLDILRFDEHIGMQPAIITRRLIGQKERISRGFLFPVHQKLVIISKIGENDGMLAIFAERSDDGSLAGIMLNLLKGNNIFATRVLIIQVTSKNKSIDANYGLINHEQAGKEVPDYLEAINNTLDQWSILQLFKLHG